MDNSFNNWHQGYIYFTLMSIVKSRNKQEGKKSKKAAVNGKTKKYVSAYINSLDSVILDG